MDDRTRTFECNHCYAIISIVFPTMGEAYTFCLDECPVCGQRKTLNDIEKPKEDENEKG